MTQQHPITPPPELVEQWCEQLFGCPDKPEIAAYELVRLGVQWGADQELEACCEWLHWQNLATHPELIPSLRAARRSKPPSLKEQALKELTWVDKHLNMPLHNHCTAIHTIRRALEQLPDNE